MSSWGNKRITCLDIPTSYIITRVRLCIQVFQMITTRAQLLVVKMLTVLVSTIFNSQAFLLEKKCELVAFTNAKATLTHFFQQKY